MSDYDYAADSYSEEINALKDHIAKLLRQLSDIPIKHPQQAYEREAAKAAIS